MRRILGLASKQSIYEPCPCGSGPLCLGMVGLIAAMWWPAVPPVTAMALVAWGATVATVARYRATGWLVPMAMANLLIYAGIYALLVGATWHTADGSTRSPGPWWTLDLLVSMLPMAGVWQCTWEAVARRGGDPLGRG